MARIRYSVAASVDGYIAGPNGEYDWIVMDPDVDFGAMMARYDVYLMGRRTFDLMKQAGGSKGPKVFVFSRTLRQEDYPKVTIVPEVNDEVIAHIRGQAEKDIWLFGGGELFRSLLDAGHVDEVEVGVIPVILGGGIPLVSPPAGRRSLTLVRHEVYAKSGIIGLTYEVSRPASAGARGTRTRSRSKAAKAPKAKAERQPRSRARGDTTT